MPPKAEIMFTGACQKIGFLLGVPLAGSYL